MAAESSVYQALMHTMTTSTDTEVAIPSHGRHPNYTFLMKGPSTTTTATRATLVRNAPRGELPPSIAEKPYLYWYTGRKWPNSLYHRPLCEAATCVIEGSDGGQDRLQCARYEVVGCPVVIERYQLSRSDTFLCRMFCSKSNPAETRVGGAVAHLAGTSAQLIHDLMCNSVAPMLLPEMGHREASWTTYTSAIDNECNSESSSSTSNSMCTMGQTGMGQPSMGRSSTGSSCGLSTTATPLTPSRLSGESTSRGLSPEIAHIEPLSAVTSLTSSSGKSATLLQFHHDSVADLIARDTLLQHLHNDPSGYRRSSSQVVMLGWEFWRTTGHDLKNLDHRAVIASVHEIMSSNGCSRTAFHRAAALLNLYLVQIASLASKQQQQHHQGGSRMPLLHPRRLPSSATIRGAIACTISVASKVSDIFPPALDRLLLSLGKEVLDLAKSFESLEMEFLTLLNFYLHPVTVEEVSDTVLELWFAHTSKPTELNNAARDVVQLTRYLVDLVVRSMTHTTLPPCYMGWCVVQYAVACVRAQRSMHPHHTNAGSLVDPFDPYDGRTIDMLVASLTHNDTKTHCTDLVRRCHIVARSRPVDFLERLYAKQRVGNHTFQGISLNAFPPVLPHGAVEATYLEALRQAS